jgi:hypothetical protein
MSQFVRSDDEEVERLYSRASEFVENVLRDTRNVNMHLAALVPNCKVSYTHLSCPFNDVNALSLTFEQHQALERTFPGARIYEERNPDTGVFEKWLELPIMHKRGARGVSASTSVMTHKTGHPTLEWPVMLLLVEMVIGGVMYFRYTMGTAW